MEASAIHVGRKPPRSEATRGPFFLSPRRKRDGRMKSEEEIDSIWRRPTVKEAADSDGGGSADGDGDEETGIVRLGISSRF
ncbi:hypothetical protein AXF42_Ash013158 [Apostasia shenzhenica]|uniref:Uncharacterized protein n=1 Tax=Apostasia shenzhenica TaxID=1088818 RepID=A0A2I0BD69_9ASPA|nr:hypothetical protein AXF42_Ash013158 [Apostasia shenzhenica]